MKPTRVWLSLTIIMAAVLVLIQFVPAARANPPAPAPLVADPALESLLRDSCYDCHSHETVWPWYSYIAPVSWILTRDVADGRRTLNFSAWEAYALDDKRELGEQVLEEVREGDMPLQQYVLLHPEALVTQADIFELEGWTAELHEAAHRASAGHNKPFARGEDDEDRGREEEEEKEEEGEEED